MTFQVLQGDCREVMKGLAENSVDSIVTDPPYELNFMSKGWDRSGIAYDLRVWVECLRVLKPGGHLLAFGGSRTYHRLACAIEDAGFEIRDQIQWIYGSGFPKSLDISKEISRIWSINLCECGGYAATKNNRTNAGFSRNDAGFETGKNERASRMYDPQVETETEQAELSESARAAANDMRKLQGSNRAESERVSPLCKSILQPQLCGSVSEETGQRNAAVWQGVEGDSPSSQRQGQGLPSLRQEGRKRTSSSPSCAVSDEWSKHDVKSSQPLPLLPYQNRKTNGGSDQQDTIFGSFGAGHINDSYLCPKCGGVLRDIGGTALKPAHEPIVLARKPLIGTVVENVLEHGTGGLNIDGCRIGTTKEVPWGSLPTDRNGRGIYGAFGAHDGGDGQDPNVGRWPANVIHDGSEEVLAGFPEVGSGVAIQRNGGGQHIGGNGIYGGSNGLSRPDVGFPDSGSAARFFYSPASPKHDKMSVCRNIFASNVADLFRTFLVTNGSSAGTNVEGWQSGLLVQNVKSAGIACDSCATHIVQGLVEIKTLVSNPPLLRACLASIGICSDSTLSLNLVSVAERWANTDTIPTTQSLLKLFGCALLAIGENIKPESPRNGNGPSRFLYVPKASKEDREEGLNDLPIRSAGEVTDRQDGSDGLNSPRAGAGRTNGSRNHHPTVKPTKLMRYLVRLVTPPVVTEMVCLSCYNASTYERSRQAETMQAVQGSVQESPQDGGVLLGRLPGQEPCYSTDAMSDVREFTESSEGEVLLEGMPLSGNAHHSNLVPEAVRALPNSVSTNKEREPEVLQSQLFGSMGGSAAQEAAYADRQGLRNALPSGQSNGEQAGVCDETPNGDGRAYRKAANKSRGSASFERTQVQQQTVQPCANDQAGARQASQRQTPHKRSVSSLPQADQVEQRCPQCDRPLVLTRRPGLVLDPFCGSGSTGKAAMLEGFQFIGIELSAEYCEIAERRIEVVTHNIQPSLFEASA